MQLLIPFASGLSDAAAQVLRDLTLPNLTQLMARLAPVPLDATEAQADADTLSPPHERALAALAGWHGADGCLPFAAQAAAHDGIDVGDAAWGLITPSHWHVGAHHVTLADPAALELTEAESRAAFDAVRDLFESEGIRFVWGATMRWYAAHGDLDGLPCASLDRVIGRDVERWMRGSAARSAAQRRIRRLQSELQLLLYPHPLNDEREHRGALTLNSFWLSGCGRRQPDASTPLQVNATLRAPLLSDDWAAWADAWRALDAGDLAALLGELRADRPVALTLCGERHAQRFERGAAVTTGPRALWQTLAAHWKRVEPHTLLEAL